MHPLETYLREMRKRRGTGAATAETSYYTPLENLLNKLGSRLRPAVVASAQLKSLGAGSPDFGLFTADQIREENPIEGAVPSRGVVEVKGLDEPVLAVSETAQVSKYWTRYRQVLVSNYREFLLISDNQGAPVIVESYQLAESAEEFWDASSDLETVVEKHGERLASFLQRAMLHAAPLAHPKDVAWLLASYARDAKIRLEEANLTDLTLLRQALEDALGLEYQGESGDRFFRSTVVQTLFYGLFSAWVLWHRENPGQDRVFYWYGATHYFNVPIIGRLFHQLIEPHQLRRLRLFELMNWAAAALNRVDRSSFFSQFDEGKAIQYFYEPFLEAFDPDLRKRLGVWYTPPEVVRYMVERVDTVLREELHLADGLADESVVVLDPACGTGAYIVEVLRKIANTIREREGEALLGTALKKAAAERIFGFEILTASFVVAHLQVGLFMREVGVPFVTDAPDPAKEERAGIYLTNALTGWGQEEAKPLLPFPELTEEREAAEEIKRNRRILVVIGNPPYDRYTDIAVGEEADLVTPYRRTKRVPKPAGPGLNDLFVRFFRIAERQIVEDTGRGVICLITNNSWLDRRSYPGMRERYLDVFNRIWIDNLHGDSRETGKLTPEGDPDPSVFSSQQNREGIRKGTAISLLARSRDAGTKAISYRDLWGKGKVARLVETMTLTGTEHYEVLHPDVELGYPFVPRTADEYYLTWPKLPALFPFSSPGVYTARDEVLVDVDKEKLIERMEAYFDPELGNDEIARSMPRIMAETRRFDPVDIRNRLLKRGLLRDNVIPYLYRPFDLRWIYWEPETKLLDEKRKEYFEQVFVGNVWLGAVRQNRKSFDPPPFTTHIASLHVIERGANFFPLQLRKESKQGHLFEPNGEPIYIPNLSGEAERYLNVLDVYPEDLFYHVLAVLYAPYYGEDHEGALRQDWPRIPLPAHAETLTKSAELGRQVAALVHEGGDVGTAAPYRVHPWLREQLEGVTIGHVYPWLRVIGLPALLGGGSWSAAKDHYTITVRWGYLDKRGATMPASGKAVERDYTDEELQALKDDERNRLLDLGETTYDIFLNEEAYWKNVPKAVWEFKLGGYQVLKKWLSYRVSDVLGRPLRMEEVRHFMHTARRIATLLLLRDHLNNNYETMKDEALEGFGVLIKKDDSTASSV